MNKQREQGFSLLELMLTLAVLGIVSALAVPAYQGYIKQGSLSVLKGRVASFHLFMENDWDVFGTYRTGAYAPGGVNDFAAIGYSFDASDDSGISFVVSNGSCTDIVRCYKVIATDRNNYTYQWDDGVETWSNL